MPTNPWRTVFKDSGGNKLQTRTLRTRPAKQMQGLNAEGQRLSFPEAKRLLKRAGINNPVKKVR